LPAFKPISPSDILLLVNFVSGTAVGRFWGRSPLATWLDSASASADNVPRIRTRIPCTPLSLVSPQDTFLFYFFCFFFADFFSASAYAAKVRGIKIVSALSAAAFHALLRIFAISL